ncbi:hypothetical protein ACFX15_040171 [Malus domestica]
MTAFSALIAKVLAIKDECLLALLRNFQNIVVESDPMIVVSSLNNSLESSDWEIFPILSPNEVTYFLASHQLSGMRKAIWVDMPSSFLVIILNKDGLPCPP